MPGKDLPCIFFVNEKRHLSFYLAESAFFYSTGVDYQSGGFIFQNIEATDTPAHSHLAGSPSEPSDRVIGRPYILASQKAD